VRSAAASQAQVLLNENFDPLTPSMEFSGPVGSSFMGTGLDRRRHV
jgi:hypothetical protein